jgi:hypothetical protein
MNADAKTDQTITDAYARAFDRAVKQRVFCYHLNATTYEVPSVSHPNESHFVRRTGQRWYDWSCDCKASAHPACVHRAVVVYAYKYKFAASRSSRTRKEVSNEHAA